MAITYDWAIANLDRRLSDGIVSVVHYTVAASDDVYAQSAYGSIGLEEPAEGEAIPYSQLTPEIVVGWVKERFGEEKVQEIEKALAAAIEEQRTPSTGSGVPWQGEE